MQFFLFGKFGKIMLVPPPKGQCPYGESSMRLPNNNLPPSVNKAAHSGFETQSGRHQKSETWVSLAPQKGLVSFKFFFSKKGKNNPGLLLIVIYFRENL